MVKINSSSTGQRNQYDIIPEIVDYIIRKVEPKMVILFGSCAKGIITIYSDIDLCIVLEGEIGSKERTKLRSELLIDLLEITDFEIDILIYAEKTWEQKHRDPGTFIGKIYKEGKILYGR